MDSKSLGDGYFVTSGGQVWSEKSQKFLKPGLGTNGRLFVFLGRGNGPHYLHTLVCTAYHGERPEGYVVSHKDGMKLNNQASNLCWETQADNLARRDEHGTHDRGTNNSRACMTDDDVRELRQDWAEGAYRIMQEAASYYGVSRTTISRILNGQRYQEVM